MGDGGAIVLSGGFQGKFGKNTGQGNIMSSDLFHAQDGGTVPLRTAHSRLWHYRRMVFGHNCLTA